MVTETTKSVALYVNMKQVRPARQFKGRFAMNTLESHRRPPPEVITHPELLPIPDPENMESSLDPLTQAAIDILIGG